MTIEQIQVLAHKLHQEEYPDWDAFRLEEESQAE